MADTESGYKWWLQYVVVPVLTAGGVIAFWLSGFTHPQGSASHGSDAEPSAQARLTSETDTDRLGSDYSVLDHFTEERCRSVCLGDDRCRAYTYDDDPTRPESYQRCFLKDAAPPMTTKLRDVSGMKIP
jgi:hypothetical protein